MTASKQGMMNHQNENYRWAQENGYEYHAETGGVFAENARDLDIFRKANGFRDHVFGTYRNRPFEILDVRKEVQRGQGFSFVENTVILIPAAGLDLPNFELLPRRETGGLNLLGIKGLDLKLSANAPRDELQLVAAFHENYLVFAGGAHEAMEAAVTSAEHLVPGLAEMAPICKPGVLRFLSGTTTGMIELQNGFLALRAPDTRVAAGMIYDTILAGRARESLLTVANDLLDVLQNASREAPLRGLTLENTFNPNHVIGGMVGAAVGFVLGFFLGFLLLFVVGKKFFLLIPMLAVGGAALGNWIGRMLMRSK
jgi:hypothetical protein